MAEPLVLSRRRVVQAAVVGTGLVLAPGALTACKSGTGTAPPAAQPEVPFQRVVVVDGAFNVRDLGSYPADGGRRVATGRVYRGGSLHRITDQGLGQLAALKLTQVIDFRGTAEAGGRLDRLPPGVSALSAPVGGAAPRGAGAVGPPPGGLTAPDPATEAEFRGYVTASEARQSFGTALRHVASSGRVTLWHCNSGTYRTGWASAVLLTALGVPRAQVYEDFLLSNAAFGATYAFAEYLDAGFGAVTATFGSFDEYLNRGLGIGPDIQAAIRRELLA
ncbi:MAG TPA: tyrosine-protein phosphatase [Micromonosporaceae bacterium]|nr:tyrosine-protein phosphatase [Micromonosporaceae bacterium]